MILWFRIHADAYHTNTRLAEAKYMVFAHSNMDLTDMATQQMDCLG